MLCKTISSVVLVFGALCSAASPESHTRKDIVSSRSTPYHTLTTSVLGSSGTYENPPRAMQSKRDSVNYISSCGSKSNYIPVDDDQDENRMGYRTATNAFCKLVSQSLNGSALLIPRNSYIRSNVVFQDETDKTGSRITLTNGKVGYIECMAPFSFLEV